MISNTEQTSRKVARNRVASILHRKEELIWHSCSMINLPLGVRTGRGSFKICCDRGEDRIGFEHNLSRASLLKSQVTVEEEECRL